MKEKKLTADWCYSPHMGGGSIPKVLVWIPSLITVNVTGEGSKIKEVHHEKAK
ncbi:hypothetical protein D9M62_002005 [Escherichia coli]|nr:hypothetical protein [Escherichia coli]